MLPKKDKTSLQAFIEEEKDEEEHSNRLINPLLDEEDFVIRTIEETENELNIWINVKQPPLNFFIKNMMRSRKMFHWKNKYQKNTTNS